MTKNVTPDTGICQPKLPHCGGETLPQWDANNKKRRSQNRAFSRDKKSHRETLRKIAHQIGFHGAELKRAIDVDALSYLRGYLPTGWSRIQTCDEQDNVSDES